MIQHVCLTLALFAAITAQFDVPAISGGVQARGNAPGEQLFAQDLHEEIAAMDDSLFAAIYDECDTGVVARLVTEDFEMYHDINGLMAASRSQFVSALERACAMQRAGEYPRMRRELTRGTMKVYPVPNYGAMQVAEHSFYELLPAGEERLIGRALLTNVWRRDVAGWMLARSLSYDHSPPNRRP